MLNVFFRIIILLTRDRFEFQPSLCLCVPGNENITDPRHQHMGGFASQVFYAPLLLRGLYNEGRAKLDVSFFISFILKVLIMYFICKIFSIKDNNFDHDMSDHNNLRS